MQRTPPFPFLPDLETPMRDALRGVSNFAEVTEDALEPAARLLPEQLRAGFHKAIKSLETTGRQWLDRPLAHSQITAAASFATGTADDAQAARDFAKTVCFAWDYLQHATSAPRLLISETILAGKLAADVGDATGAARAAALVGVIRQSAAIGRMPGIADSLPAAERAQTDLALVAIMTWLRAARADTLDEEMSLLDLAMALVTAIRSDVQAAIDAPAPLAAILQNASAHL